MTRDTQSVIDTMTSAIANRKAEKAAGLTPVGVESTPPKQQFAPLESPYSLSPSIARIRENMAQLDKYLSAIEGDVRVIEEHRVSPKRNPDKVAPWDAGPAPETFPTRMERLSDEAKAATFTGWKCPEHDDTDLRDLTSGRGRKYRSCGVTSCKEFERA